MKFSMNKFNNNNNNLLRLLLLIIVVVVDLSFAQQSPPDPGQRNFNNNNGSPSTDNVTPLPSNDQYRRPDLEPPSTDVVTPSPSNDQYHRPDLDTPSTDVVTPSPSNDQYRRPDLDTPKTDKVLPNQGTSPLDSMQGDDPSAYSNSNYQPPEPGQRNFGNNNYGSPRTDIVTPNQYRRPDLDSPRTDRVLPNQGTSFSNSMQGDDPSVYSSSNFQPPEPGRRNFDNNNYGSPRTDIVVPSNDQYRRPDVNSNDQYRRPTSNSPRTDIVVPSNDPYRRPELGSTTVVVPSVPNGGNNNGRYSQPPEPGQSELRPYRTTRGIDLNSPRTDIVLPPNNQYRRPDVNSNNQYRRPDVNSNDQYRRPTSNSPRTDIVIPTSSLSTTQSINNNGEKENIFEDEQMQGDDPNPIEPGHRDFNQRSSTTVFVPSYRPPEPGRPDFHRPTTNGEIYVPPAPNNDGGVYVPPAPNNNDGGVYVPPAPNNNDGGVYVPPAPNNNNNNQRYPPSTDPILPPNYGSNRRPYNSPSTDRILPTSPSTTPIQIIASYPGGGNSPSTSSIVVPSINNAPEPGRREFFDRNRPYWQCNMANNNNDQCRLENRANFVQFKRGLYQNTHALLLDITEAIRLKESLPRLNPVRSYNAGRLVTKDYFPANNNRIACLHFSFVWDGPEDKRMHLIQRNSDDKCIYSTHSHGLNDQHNGRWQDLELQLDLSQGDLAFLIEFSFDINRSSMIDNQTRRPYPIQTSNTTNAFGRYDSIIAVRDFTIGYGYCKNNQAIECDLPI
uniref:GATA zinc finger domain-containing protein 14-like n=1 Tax=Dermatophagoides pteronyssinus TaxID=6956 RepID=A0A6P6YFZ8_DERPT|nr:putative uncharacterized protein DDB_G0282133 isoform X8 [Dermatophagoides pteronyssinus]